jgi:DNA-binding Lrp family transcriptional regulator
MTPLFRHPALVIADRWQRGFPLRARPFAEIGASHDLSETETLAALDALKANGMLSRIGAVVRPNLAGASTLAALSCPPAETDMMARLISAEAFVNHNYERDHPINLWFVVAAPNRKDLDSTLRRISLATGKRVLDLRLQQPYHIDLGFSLSRDIIRRDHAVTATRAATAQERALLAAIEDGLPLVPEPYAAAGATLGWTAERVMTALQDMVSGGVISRFGCVLHHRNIGFTANAMAVWDVPDEEVDALGLVLSRQPHVTLCYRRNRNLPDWPYNLFAMIHGRNEEAVRQRIAALAITVGLDACPSAILFSRRCFTQRGARFATPGRAAA